MATAAVFLAFKVSDIAYPLRNILEACYASYKRMREEDVKKLFVEKPARAPPPPCPAQPTCVLRAWPSVALSLVPHSHRTTTGP